MADYTNHPPADDGMDLNEDRGYELLTVSAFMLVLQIVAVGLRFWARRITRATLSVDDWLIVPALVSRCSSFRRAFCAGAFKLGEIALAVVGLLGETL